MRRDPHSYNDDTQAETASIALTARVDFAARVLHAEAELTFEQPGAGTLDLDTRDLHIERVSDSHGATLPFTLHPAEPFLGAEAVPDAAFADLDLLVLSPGVPPAPFRAAQRRLAPRAAVHGEISLSLAAAADRWGRLPTVLITGTNGKSTVTALTGALLAAAGRRPFIGGNLGVPLAAALLAALTVDAAAPDSLVLECSSFQLETLGAHPTNVA